MAAAVEMLKNELNADSDEMFTGLAEEEQKQLENSLATLGIQASEVIGSFKKTGNACQVEFVHALKHLAQFATPTYTAVQESRHNGKDNQVSVEDTDSLRPDLCFCADDQKLRD